MTPTKKPWRSKKDKYDVWYCTKFDELWLYRIYGWNKYLCAGFIGYHEDGSEWWETLTWPRPEGNVYVGKF